MERKTWSVAFHYRRVPQVAREAVQVEVDALIEEWLRKHPGYERLGGNKVVEVRPSRMRKSLSIPWLREHLGPELRLLALGDDLTDEHMFHALGVKSAAIFAGWAIAGRWDSSCTSPSPAPICSGCCPGQSNCWTPCSTIT